ncbi:MAG: hypothetical protein WC711_04280 [Candidatus Staskawiczbacteria bacterium]|jgi:site-specific recombinase XerD
MKMMLRCSLCQKEVVRFTNVKLFLCPECSLQNCLKKRFVKIEDVSNLVQIKDEYNQYLFGLYLQYVNRYYLKYPILKQAEDLLKYLTVNQITPFTTWEKIFDESMLYRKQYKVINGLTGCPFVKIGKMLNELGVLPPKSEDHSQFFIKILSKFPLEKRETIKRYIVFEKNKKILDKTVRLRLDFLFYFQQWSSVDIYFLNAIDIQNYFIYLKDKGHSQSYMRLSFTSLFTFFDWCKLEKIIFVNPCIGIKIQRPTHQLTVCDENTVKKLMRFIKNPNSNPEQAFLLALILIWGFRSEDLSFAKIEVNKNIFTIIFRRKKLGTIKYYNRKQVLKLPKEPKWLHSLQKRFYEKWLVQYKHLHKNYPNYYLMLPRYRSVQTLTKGTILARVFEATYAAVGEKIPPKVLRKSCGNLHSTSSDASLLSALGWSSEYCFRYTWLPRSYFQSFKK